MSFMKESQNKTQLSKLKNKQKRKKALQVYSLTGLKTSCIVTLKQFSFLQRMSSFFLTKVRAAVSVEAALSLSLFIFFVVNLLSLINAFQNYSKELAFSGQTAKALSFDSHDIVPGDSDIVTIFKVVPLNPLIDSIGFNSASSVARMKYRKWTGYCVTSTTKEKKEDEYVYITEHGYVYHKNPDCSHLKVTISMIDSSSVDNYRNKSGSRYRPCELCGGYKTGALFVTPEGDRYHCSAECSGLRRNIKLVKLSEVGGRGPCSECG